VRNGGVGTFAGAPWAARVYSLAIIAASLALPLLLSDSAAPDPRRPVGLTLALLIGVAVVNVEMGRVLLRGRNVGQQPHKALSAWAFACGLLLPPPWLLVVVPVTYLHARWRGIVVPAWKWILSAAQLVLCGLAAGIVAHAVLSSPATGANWMGGNGGLGLVAIIVAAVTFLAAEVLQLTGSALLNHAEDEAWLRRTLRSPSFHLTELAVLLIGGLLCAVWTGGAWFVLLFLPLSMLAQRAVLHDPLTASNQALERDNRFKADLVGMLGHEIGNPLTSVLGHAQVGAEALAGGDTAQAARSLEVVERNAEQVRIVLHDILTLVASENGQIQARPERCEVEPVVLHAVATASSRAQVSVEPGLAVLVAPHHLVQVLSNLLSNAEKYAGGATSVRAVAAPGETVTIHVADAGPGVPPSLREQLFERFARGSETSDAVAGSGLGLFISRELARANAGDLEHRDDTTSGAEFVLRLPRG
jgi:signal transduction histidine kinase